MTRAVTPAPAAASTCTSFPARPIAGAESPDGRPAVLLVDDDAGLCRVREDGVVAAIRLPGRLPAWQRALEHAVLAGRFVQRAETADLAPSQLLDWATAAAGQLDAAIRDGFAADVRALGQLCATLAGASRVQVRLAAGLGSDRCGYHVDTCRPGAPPIGVVKAYCGPPTQYPDPATVTSVADFWAYLSRRERLVRERAGAHGAAVASARQELALLDDAPGFITSAGPLDVPVGATVAFRLLPVEEHWQSRRALPAWIHRSAMCAQPRLAVSVLAAPGVVAASLRQRARAVMAKDNTGQPVTRSFELGEAQP